MREWLGMRAMAVAGAMNVLAGCTATPPPHLYVLNAAPEHSAKPVRAAAANRERLIGVIPVSVADYLDRPEIVIRSTNNEITTSDSQRWAERLSTSATGVIVENLSALLGSERIVALPARATVDYEVALDLRRFEIDADWQAVMIGRWSVIDTKTSKEIASGGLRESEPVAGRAFDGVAAAMSRNLAVASSEIADAIARPHAPGKKSEHTALLGAK